MSTRILIIGNTSQSYHIGAIFIRASQVLNLNFSVNDINWNSYAPSMQYKWGRALFKLLGKRPVEWWSFNHNVMRRIKNFCPQVILVTGIFPLTNEVFYICSQIGARIVNYLTDDPWNPYHHCSKFLSNLKKYDLVVSTKTQILSDLAKNGVQKFYFLPFAYDPFLHYHPKEIVQIDKDQFVADIAFIGTGDVERIPYLNAISSLNGLNLKIYGGAWNKISIKKWQKQPAVFENDFRLAICCSKLSLGIVRKRNRDESTMRTFEIAACGGCGIYEDTPEHREILTGYPDYGFFCSPDDLADKCKWLLEHPVEREQLRQLGIQLIVTEANTYAARLKRILELVGK